MKARVDVSNFRDYFVLQAFVMNYDQPGKNVRFWRSRAVDPANPQADGRWRWLLFDLDATFGHDNETNPVDRNALIWNTGLVNINSTEVIGPTPPPEWAVNRPEATLPMRRLLSNPEFRVDFISRFSDLLNTVFTPRHMLALVSEFRSEVEPYMGEHIRRWGHRPP